MCRLMAYVHAGSTQTMRASLGETVLEEFRQLAQVNRDGWGAAWRRGDNLSSYHSSAAAHVDEALFCAVTDQPLRAAIVHERWASAGIARVPANQQPFVFAGTEFAHNGTIGDRDGNIVQRPADFRQSLGLMNSSTQSDSQLYGELVLHYLDALRSPPAAEAGPTAQQVWRALSLAIAQLREHYPECSYNAVIQTAEFTLAVEAHADQPALSAVAQKRYKEAGWSHRIDSYGQLLYTSLDHGGGARTGIVSSSGYPASDGWTPLGNDTVLVLPHHGANLLRWALGSRAQYEPIERG